MALEELLELCEQPGHDDRRDDRRGIGDQGHRDAEEVKRRMCSVGCGDRGVEHGEHDSERHILVRLELLGSRDGQDEGKELHEAIGAGIQDRVGTGLAEAGDEVGEHDQERLEHAGRDEAAHEGEEDAGDRLGEAVEDIALLLVIVCGDLAAGKLGAELGDGSIVCIFDIGANHDLVLAIAVHDIDHARSLLDGSIVCLGLILEDEAQAGDAVRHGDDIVLSTDLVYHRRCESLVILCHVASFLPEGIVPSPVC